MRLSTCEDAKSALISGSLLVVVGVFLCLLRVVFCWIIVDVVECEFDC